MMANRALEGTNASIGASRAKQRRKLDLNMFISLSIVAIVSNKDQLSMVSSKQEQSFGVLFFGRSVW